jgi:prepilin-type N-terminal cleavage/methylation domain-containing protein
MHEMTNGEKVPSFVIRHSHFMFRINPHRRPRGLTLVEVLLVLTLLVVVGAVTAPLLEGSFSRAGLNSAADVLRGAWAKARLAAMQTGQPYAFRLEPNGSRFQILALNELGLPESNVLEPETNVEHKAVDMLRLPQTRLPDGIVFTAGEVSTSNQLLATIPGAAEGPWSSPIVFHPDGTTSDASILLSNSQQTTIRVTLRGLTGVSNTTDAPTEPPAP